MNQHHSLSTYTWDALKVNANQTKILWNSTKTCSNNVFLLDQLKNYQDETNIQQKTEALSYYMEETAEKCGKNVANRQTKKAEQLYRASSPCFDDHHIKKRNLNQLENGHKYAHKLFLPACILHELVGQTSYGQRTNFLDQSTNQHKLVTDNWQDSFHTFITQETTVNVVT